MPTCRPLAVRWCLPLLLLTVAWPAPAAGPDAASGKLRVYLGTYTGTGSKGIYRSEIDLATGRLADPVLAAETPSPSFLAVSPDGRYLYAVNETDNYQGGKTGSVSAFQLDPKTGDLKALNQRPSAGTAPCHLAVDRNGRHVIVANYGSGSVAVLPIEADGRLGKATDVVQHRGQSADPQRQEGPHAHCVILDRANRFALVCDLGLDRVMLYRYDAQQGKLTPNDPPSAALPPGSGPRHLAFTPDERFLYVNNEMASTVAAFSYRAKDGSPKRLQVLSTLPKGDQQPGNSTAETVVHPSGKWVYVSNRGYNSIAGYAIDRQTGKLTPIGQQRRGINVPRNFAIDPTGTWAVVANQDGKSVIVFRIDPQTGKLQPTEHRIEVSNPVCVLFVQPSA